MDLDVMEFIRRFLQHVLPTGFMKVRYYGFLSPNSAVSLEEVRAKIELAYGFEVTEPGKGRPLRAWFTCGNAEGRL